MTEVRHYPFLLEAVGNNLGSRPNIQPAIDHMNRHPENFDRIVWQFDQAVDHLTGFANPRYTLRGTEDPYLPTILKIRKDFPGIRFPRLSDIAGLEKYKAIGNKTLQEVSGLMLNREWQFHEQILDAEELTAALAIELYGKLMDNLRPSLRQDGISTVVAVEEILAWYENLQHTDLFMAASPYYTKEEGFSAALVQRVSAIDRSKLVRRRPERLKPQEVKIIEITDSDATIAEASAPLLGASTPAELRIEQIIKNELSSIRQTLANRRFLVHWFGTSPWSRDSGPLSVGNHLVTWIQHGMVSDQGGNIMGIYDRVISGGGRHGDENLVVFDLK